jgi:chemotaxis protein MotC
MAYTPELGAYLALVKASVLSDEKPQQAVRLLDQARLLSPGTLVEEAALRRSIALSAKLNDPKRFLLASAQYVRAYLHSPYASQFADAFVAGVIALHAGLDLAQVGEVASMMDAEREKVIYLRIARRAAIDGLKELSAFAAAKAEGDTDDPRALLYSSLSSVTSDTVSDVAAKLARIDRSRLSESDRQLFDAASAIAAEMTAAPAKTPLDDVSPGNEAAVPMAAKAAAEEVPVAGPTHPDLAGAPAAVTTASAESPAVPVASADAADMMMADTRKKLDDIDKLLGDAAE